MSSSAATASTSASASTLLATLIPVALYAAVYFALFLFLRRKFPRQYYPRSMNLPTLRPHERSPALATGLTDWFKDFWQISDTYVLNHHSLDAFLLLRFLKGSVVTLIVGCCITFPILWPLYATGGGGSSELDVLNMGNVAGSTATYYRYFGTVFCAYAFFGYILYWITRESIYYINLRQAYLLSPLYSSRMSSRTVLFTSVPPEYTNEQVLRRTLGSSVRRVWLATDCKELDDMVSKRDKAAMKLEAGETKLMKKALKAKAKAEKNNKGSATENGYSAETGRGQASQWLNPKDRPTHKLGPLGLWGKKVDTIEWARQEITTLIPQIEQQQDSHKDPNSGKATLLNSVFVEFETLADAQAAYQSLTHHQALHMAPRYTGMTPGEIIWSNLRIKWWERVIRLLVTTTIVVLLIIFWSIPVAFVGAISNVQSLASSRSPALSWLAFINDIPAPILGVVTGLLPSILLAVLMALLPIFLRWMAKLSGDPTYSAVELSTQNYYFGFQVVQVFLVATVGSAASSVVGGSLSNFSITELPTLLAQKIPRASNFYLGYFVLQGLAVVSSMLLHIVGVIIFIALSKILDSTPRKMYKRWVSLSSVGWGTVFPIYTNLVVIAICYSCIAPFVMFFAAIGMFFFYTAYRYNLLFVNNCAIDTKGKVYPQALGHLFIGLYVAEVCLVVLFAIGTSASVGAIGPLILMIIFLIFTVLYQSSLNTALKPLIDFLPKSLEAEERRLLEEEQLAEKEGKPRSNDLGVAPHEKPSLFQKFFKPHIYNDYATMRRLVPREIEIRYEPEEEAHAYYNPSISSTMPLLWIPRDPLGISEQEIKDTPKVITMTDEGATIDENAKMTWDQSNERPPIYEEPVYY